MMVHNHCILSSTNAVLKRRRTVIAMPIVYSRDILFACGHVSAMSKFTFIDRLSECGLLRYCGSRGGRLTHTCRAAAQPIPKVNNDMEIPNLKLIPAVVGNRATAGFCRTKRPRVLVDVVQQTAVSLPSKNNVEFPPTMYAITKPHAIEHLSADVTGYNADIAVITEMQLKKKRADHNFTVNDYTLFRRDQAGRRGGGVAVYVN